MRCLAHKHGQHHCQQHDHTDKDERSPNITGADHLANSKGNNDEGQRQFEEGFDSRITPALFGWNQVGDQALGGAMTDIGRNHREDNDGKQGSVTRHPVHCAGDHTHRKEGKDLQDTA